jgi:mannose-6-phosphate isomerase-like protein (cupin superfamily)
MPVVDYGALPEFPMRPGITGKWIASRERGAGGVGVLANTIQAGCGAPLHRHEYEEVILVEAGKIWVEMDKVRTTATPGQCVIIPANAAHAWGNEGRRSCGFCSSGTRPSRSHRARAPISKARRPPSPEGQSLAPDAFTGAWKLLTCLATKAVNSAGLIGLVTKPRSPRRSMILGSARTSVAALCSLA